MTNRIRKSDVNDNDFLDAEELASDGYFVYRNINLSSTNNVTNEVTISPSSTVDILNNVDEPVQSGDRIQIIGSTAADGYYTVDSITSDTVFTVIETIVNSTGGSADFMHPSGSSKIGFDARFTNIDGYNVQDALEFIDSEITNINSSLLTPPIDPTEDGYVPIASGGDFTYIRGEDGYVLTWSDSNNQWEAQPAQGSGLKNATFEFALSEDVFNFNPFFFTWRATGSDTDTGKRSTSSSGMSFSNACTPYVVPFDATIIKAVLVLRGAGVQNGSVIYPVNYQTDLLSVGFTSNTKLADVDFPISNSFTVGTFSPANTNFRGSIDLDIDVNEGDTLGLQFINGTGPSLVGQSRMAFVIFTLEER